jgi:hypothetical protein
VFFTDKNMLFLVEEEVRTHDSGFKLSGFGWASKAMDVDQGQPGFEFFLVVEIDACPPHKISQESEGIPTL